MNAGSISATKRSAIGGIGSARCSLAKSGKSASLKCEVFGNSNGTSTRPLPEPFLPVIAPPGSITHCATGSKVMKINGETHYLWRAVDHEVLEALRHRFRSVTNGRR